MTAYNDTLTEAVTVADIVLGINAAILSDGLTFDELTATVGDLHNIVLDTTTLNEILIGLSAVPVVDGFTIGDSILAALINNLIESVGISDVLTSSANRSMSVIDSVKIYDLIHIALNALVVEDITEADTLQGLLQRVGVILDKLTIADVNASRAEMAIAIASALTLSSFLNISQFVEVLSDTFTASDVIVEIFNLSVAIVDILSINDLPSNSVGIHLIATDDFNLSDITSNTADLFDILSEDLVFILTMDDGSTVYQGITMNPESYSITEYDNYNFNSTTNFNGTYLLASTSGLFSMGGTTDNGTYITSKIKTASLDFGTSNIKQCPKVYLGIDNDSSLILRVVVDGKYASTYQLDIDSQDLSTQIFDIGKGLKGRYWQFELQTKGNSTFDLDQLELFPIQWGRKK